MRSGAANTKRSDDDEEERGKHQRDPKVFTNQQTCHYLDHFGAQRLRPSIVVDSKGKVFVNEDAYDFRLEHVHRAAAPESSGDQSRRIGTGWALPSRPYWHFWVCGGSTTALYLSL